MPCIRPPSLVTTVDNASELRDLFKSYARQDQFSHKGFRFLFDYLQSYAEDTGTNVHLDVIDLCCEYSEMTYDEIASAYTDIDLSYFIDGEDVGAGEDLVKERVLDYLNDHTTVCGYDDDIVVYAVF